MSKKNPRVLIVGVTFDETNGSGITMTNLFSKFSKDDLAVIVPNWNAHLSDFKKCPRVYQLGSQEVREIFPVNLFQKDIYSGPLDPKTTGAAKTISTGKFKKIKAALRRTAYQLLAIFGMNHIIHSTKESKKLAKWIDDFKPDVIYCQLASVNMIRLFGKLAQKHNLPSIIHTMDDWPSIINQPSLTYFYWRKTIDREFRKLINESSLFLSISDEMREEYFKRYGKDSTAYHNPIDLDRWLPYTKQGWGIKGRCRIVYFGGINVLSNHIAIRDLARAVDRLNREGQKIDFDICSFQSGDKITEGLDKYRGVKLCKPLSHDKMPELLSSYDLCVIPLNLNRFTNVFAKLSMPTKASESMISGVPTIVYAANTTGLYRNAKKNGWAYTVGSRNQDELCTAIMKMVSDQQLRTTIAKTAVKYAKNKFDIKKVSTDFKNRIASAVK